MPIYFAREPSAKTVYFLEEGYRQGGVSEKVASALRGEKRIMIHAIESFVEHGVLKELYEFCGFTAENVAKNLLNM